VLNTGLLGVRASLVESSIHRKTPGHDRKML
jgi:hypothetical protein